MSKRKALDNTKFKEYKIPRFDDQDNNSEDPKRTVVKAIMFCWGSTIHGELGLGGVDQDHIASPQALNFSEAHNVIQVACGDTHTVMLTSTGGIYTCGSNDHGQLGHEKTRSKPELVDRLASYSMMSASCGGSHTLACNEWGQLFGWGSDAHGQLALTGDSQPTPKIIKGLATTHVVQAACGQTHSLALTCNGDLYAWGGNGHSQLGNGQRGGTERSPVLVKSLKGVPIALIACGAYHSFVVSKSGAVFGWGLNSHGQLGLNDTETRRYPTQLRTHRKFKIKYIACGENFSVFLSADGGVFTCGAGTYGQLGHGSATDELLPRKVMELMGSTVTQISCGRRHTLALVPSRGHVYSFGVGGSGQLGTRSSSNASTPQVVRGPWVSPGGVSMLGPTTADESVIVTSVFSGGDQCFVTVAKVHNNVKPDDRRIYKEKTQVLTIIDNKIAQCRAVPVDEVVDQELLEYLEIVFKSPSCFNSSFLLPNDEHYCCSSKHHGVDLKMAENVLTDIGRIENESIKDMIWDGIVNEIIPGLTEPPDLEALRIYLVLPLYHQFENPKHADRLQGPFAEKVNSMKNSAAKALHTWWSGECSEYFEKLVRIYKNVVLHKLKNVISERRCVVESQQSTLQSLDLLATLNRLNNNVEDLRVPYEAFYLPELSSLVEIENDYLAWSFKRPSPFDFYFCDYPFLFDATAKTVLLQVDMKLKMHMAMTGYTVMVNNTGELILTQNQFLCLNISRDNIVQSTISQLMACHPKELQKPLKVKFLGEEAEDGGGVKKEFFLLVMKEVLDPKFGMFKNYEETRTIWFSDVPFEEDNMYAFIGRLCGLAIYNFTIIELPFPLALYKKILNEKVSYHDLKGLSPTLYKSLQDLLDYENDDLEDVFCLTFEITREIFGEVKTVELKENGSNISVTQANKREFVDLHTDFVLNKSIEKSFSAFSEGFHGVCGSTMLQLFHAQELMALVVGNENYDWHVFEANTTYKGNYTAEDPTIRLFWEVFHELSHQEKKKFLLFLTGSDRIPIQGMEGVKIVIQPTHDDKYLPVAHTCFNLLDLPPYKTKERLRYKLLQAIQQHQGFSLV